MRILFDHGTPSGIIPRLTGHAVTEARDRGWDRISNGDLLDVAESAGFDILPTTDKNMRIFSIIRGSSKAEGNWGGQR